MQEFSVNNQGIRINGGKIERIEVNPGIVTITMEQPHQFVSAPNSGNFGLVLDFAKQGAKIKAIKELRNIVPLGLRESNSIVDILHDALKNL
jgi:ribosomal protein L7/L12